MKGNKLIDESEESEEKEESEDNISSENETNAKEEKNNINNEKENDLIKVTKKKKDKKEEEKKEEEKKEEEKKEGLIAIEIKDKESTGGEQVQKSLIDDTKNEKPKDLISVGGDNKIENDKESTGGEQVQKSLIDDTKSEKPKDLISVGGGNNIEKDKESIKLDVKKDNSVSEDPKANQTGYDEDPKNNDSSSFSMTVPIGDTSSQNSEKKSNKSKSKIANPPFRDKEDSTSRKINKEKNKKKGKKKNKKRGQKEEEKVPCCKSYKDYIYTINKDFEKNKCNFSLCDSDSKCKCHDYFLAKMISENTLLFVVACSKDDKNRSFIRLSILLIYIGWYMCFNLLTEFNSSDLHLLLQRQEENNGSKFASWLINAILPYICVYLIIRYFRKSISLREFYLEEKERIIYIKNTYENEEIITKLHTERTRIKRFKNIFFNNIKIVVTIGFIILGYNAYLSYCFFGIYRNSFWCIVVNILSSICSSFVISIIINLIESIFTCNKCREFLFCIYMNFCCLFCYCILNKIFKSRDEFNDLKDYYEDDDNPEDSRNPIVINQDNTMEATINQKIQ